jgi:hypothetical protein
MNHAVHNKIVSFIGSIADHNQTQSTKIDRAMIRRKQQTMKNILTTEYTEFYLLCFPCIPWLKFTGRWPPSCSLLGL